jgi:hypothetical protein
METHKLNIESAIQFIFGGNSTFTVVSKATNNRFTFKVKKGKDETSPFFVSYLFGNDNDSSYKFMGTIFVEGKNKYKYFHSRKKINKYSQVNKTFEWVYNVLRTQNKQKFEMIEFWHEGKCGQCGKKLTVPSSIESGFGPVCSNNKRNEKYNIRKNAVDFLLRFKYK